MSSPDVRAWQQKLQGKLYIGCTQFQQEPAHTAAEEPDSDKVFKKEDLPENNRVVAEGEPMTKDYNPERLTVHLDAEGRCIRCEFV